MSKTIHSAIKVPTLPKPPPPETHKPGPFLKKVIRTSRWLSLDVAAGAVFSSAMVCRLMHVSPIPWTQLLILGGVVMLIYTLDHLWDVRHMNSIPVTARHSFHWRFNQELRWFAGSLFCIIGIGAVLVLPLEVFYFGSILGCTVVVYLWLVNFLPLHQAKQWFHKEIYIAIIYTAGIWGSVWVQANHIKPVHWLLALLFCITALLNLLLFSIYEQEEDLMQSQRSIAVTWGKDKVRMSCNFLYILFAVTVITISYNKLQLIERRVLYIECLMAAILLLLFSFPAYFKKQYRYRWIGDGIFLLPALILL